MKLQIEISDIKKEDNKMEAILAFVQELLTHLKEFDAAAIIEIIKNLLLFPDILNIDILSLLQLKI